MADKKTGSARRPSRDEDDVPKKKTSGNQKPIKKGTSSRKAASDEDGDEEDAPRPAKKGSARTSRGDSARASRGDSARSGGGPGGKKGADGGKIFLYFVPGVILLLLGMGYYVATLPDAKPETKQTISFDGKVAEAKQKYIKAKAAYQDGSGKEGAAGLPKLKEAKGLLEEAQKIIDGVREDLEKLENSTDKNVQLKDGQKSGSDKATEHSYQFDNDSTQINQLLVMCRKAILERE